MKTDIDFKYIEANLRLLRTTMEENVIYNVMSREHTVESVSVIDIDKWIGFSIANTYRTYYRWDFIMIISNSIWRQTHEYRL